MNATPLVAIPEQRRARELRRAVALGSADRSHLRDVVMTTGLCITWFFLGCLLLGLGFHLTDSDKAESAFLAGILVANGGPMWTVIIRRWLADQR